MRVGDVQVTCPHCEHELTVPVETEVLPRKPESKRVELALIPRVEAIHDHVEACCGGC